MIPALARSGYKRYRQGTFQSGMRAALVRSSYSTSSNSTYGPSHDPSPETEAFLKPFQDDPSHDAEPRTHLALLPTAKLSLAFCFLWFVANYFAIGCLQHTTVASATILTSTSSIWTLLIGSITGTEKFTYRKLCGVFASFLGIVLISRADLSSDTSAEAPTLTTRSPIDFPDKRPSEIALGDSLALFSAMLYGIYAITLKKTTDRARSLSLNMPLFFGMVGLFNFILLMPIFPILHYSGWETFSLPPTRRIWTILLVNSMSSLAADICWAYAMVLTSPLVVTVGLSLCIPFSLVGEMILQGRYEGWLYWIGAAVVVSSFVFVDGEERKDEVAVGEGAEQANTGDAEAGDGAVEGLLLARHESGICDSAGETMDDDAVRTRSTR